MQQSDPFAASSWYRALDLLERLAIWRRAGSPAFERDDAAERRSRRWRSQRPFDVEGLFEKRLAAVGMTEAEFESLMAVSAEDLARWSDEPPAWLTELAEAYGDEESRSGPWEVPREPLLVFVDPLIRRGVGRLVEVARKILAEDPGAPFEAAKAVELLRPALEIDLFQVVFKTLVLELNVARLEGVLEGESSPERFSSFVRRLSQRRHAQSILKEYPVLARQAVWAVERWVRFGTEFLTHLAEDRADLEQLLGGGQSLGVLEDLSGGAGDSHRGGRSVQILRFDSGLKTVYKPRSLAVDVHYYDLIEWLNERGDHPPFRTLVTLDRGDHGWVEFVETKPCTNEDEIERFYERQGGFLALLYVLEANDFHFENVLAAGEHPVLIDLESLFQQRVFLYDLGKATEKASSIITFSVIRTGLLPQFVWNGDGGSTIEVSGLGGQSGQKAGTGRPMPDRIGTDEMRLELERTEFEGGANRPTLNGEEVAAVDWAPAIERGFESVYRLMMRHREELVAPTGPLQAFADAEVRVILRHTKTYRAFLLDGLHPDHLRDALDRDRSFDRLWAGVDQREAIEQLAPLERRELAVLDIPLFASRPGRLDLISASGETVPGFFERSGLEIVRERVSSLDQGDLERQRWMIGACLTALDSTLPVSERRNVTLDEVEPAKAERLIEAARLVGNRLETLALLGDDGGASWLGISATDDVHYMPSALGLDLYSGLGGVALFLAYLGDVSGEDRFTDLSRAAWKTLSENLAEAGEPGVGELGAFTGIAGSIYLTVHLSRLWGDEFPLSTARSQVEVVARAIGNDVDLDVISGAAGCIPVLLTYAEMTGDETARDAALACGERLLEAARPVGPGLGWFPRQSPEVALSGFSHGGAGFAWSLLELHAATGDARFEEAALGALAYERTLYDAEQGNWRDLRSFLGPEGGFNIAWCNGAVGIGLARLASLHHFRGAERAVVLEEIDQAVATTFAAGFSLNHSLCHGALGNFELLAGAGRRLGREDCAHRVAQAAAVVCEEVERGHFHCGVPGGFETPGLMDGLAGIGFGLLRLALPERIPSVLLLEGVAGGRTVAARDEDRSLAWVS